MSDGEIHKIFKKHLPTFDWQRIESQSTGSGIPDLNGCKNHTEVWIENKATAYWRVTIRPMQIGWAERRLRHGGRVFVAVRRAGTELWLFDAKLMRALMDCKIDAVPNLGHWTGGPARWNWDQIEQELLYR